jgi:glycerate kinase
MPAVISKMVLVLAEAFARGMDGTSVAEAIGRGLQTGERLACDLCPIYERSDGGRGTASALLDELDFDRRMRTSRALVIARERLDDRTLAGSIAFEAATRARQAGVPTYAVTGHNALDPFEARILDLQVILEASTPRALCAAGHKLAGLV